MSVLFQFGVGNKVFFVIRLLPYHQSPSVLHATGYMFVSKTWNDPMILLNFLFHSLWISFLRSSEFSCSSQVTGFPSKAQSPGKCLILSGFYCSKSVWIKWIVCPADSCLFCNTNISLTLNIFWKNLYEMQYLHISFQINLARFKSAVPYFFPTVHPLWNIEDMKFWRQIIITGKSEVLYKDTNSKYTIGRKRKLKKKLNAPNNIGRKVKHQKATLFSVSDRSDDLKFS